MAYDEIRISELPALSDIHNNDLILVNDVSNNLSHSIDWNNLKNSIGKLSSGITFPLGTPEAPQIAVGDHTSGIYGSDFGTFHIVTHGFSRIQVNQAGTTEIVNGNVVIGNYDRQCTFNLIVNNIARFNCFTKFEGDAGVGGNLGVDGNITGGGDLAILGNAVLGKDCETNLIIYSNTFIDCDLEVKGHIYGGDVLRIQKNGSILGNVVLNTNCDNKTDIYGNTHIFCDLRVDGDLSLGGGLLVDGDTVIGKGCSQNLFLNAFTTVNCDLLVHGTATIRGDIFGNSNIIGDGDLMIAHNVTLGSSCSDTTYINSELFVDCDTEIRSDTIIGRQNNPCNPAAPSLTVRGYQTNDCGLNVDEDLIVGHDVTLGTTCADNLTVNSVSLFNCDAEFTDNVKIDGSLGVGGDLVCTGNTIELGDPNATVCPQIDLLGNVHVKCDLKVDGDIQFDGDLGFGGALIEFGDDCATTTINLKGVTTIYCDTEIKENLIVRENATIGSDCNNLVEIKANLNVDCDAAFDENVYIHKSSYVSKPLGPGNIIFEDYQHCCVLPEAGKQPSVSGLRKCLPRDDVEGFETTYDELYTIVYSQFDTRCIVDLNDKRFYFEDQKDEMSHPQYTHNWGHLWAHSRVELNGYHPVDIWGADPHGQGNVDIENFGMFHPSPRKGNHDDAGRRNERQTTTIRGMHTSLADVHLNEPLLYRSANAVPGTLGNGNQSNGSADYNTDEMVFLGTPVSGLDFTDGPGHRMNTNIYGHLLARSNVHLNSAAIDDFNSRAADQMTTVHGQFASLCNVRLNDERQYNNSNGTAQGTMSTHVHGIFHAQNKVVLNSNSKDDQTTRNTGQTTHILGVQYSLCDVYLNTDCGDITQVNGNFTAKGEVRLSTACGKDTYIYEDCHVGSGGGNSGKDLYVGDNRFTGNGGFDVKNGVGTSRGTGVSKTNNSQVLSTNGDDNPDWIDTVNSIKCTPDGKGGSIDVTGDVASDPYQGNTTVAVNVPWLHKTVGEGAHTTKTTASITATGASYGGSGKFTATEWSYAVNDGYINGLIDNKINAIDFCGKTSGCGYGDGSGGGTGGGGRDCKNTGVNVTNKCKGNGDIEITVQVQNECGNKQGTTTIPASCLAGEGGDPCEYNNVLANRVKINSWGTKDDPSLMIGTERPWVVSMCGNVDNGAPAIRGTATSNDPGPGGPDCSGGIKSEAYQLYQFQIDPTKSADKGGENRVKLFTTPWTKTAHKANFWISTDGNCQRLENPTRRNTVPAAVDNHTTRFMGTDDIIAELDAIPTNNLVEFRRFTEYDDGDIDNTPLLTLNDNLIQSISPHLCYFKYSDDSYYKEAGESGFDEERLHSEESGLRVIELDGVNFENLTVLNMLGARKARQRIAELEAKVAELESQLETKTSPIMFEDVVKIDHHALVNASDDTQAALLGVEVDQIYRDGNTLKVRTDH